MISKTNINMLPNGLSVEEQHLFEEHFVLMIG